MEQHDTDNRRDKLATAQGVVPLSYVVDFVIKEPAGVNSPVGFFVAQKEKE